MARLVTMKDVAAVAGVSTSTVSKVLNGGGRVSAETRTRITSAASRLDYRPNALAQSFAKGKSQTIGILAQNATGTFAMSVLVGAYTASSDRDMANLMYDYQFDAKKLAENVRKLQARHIDALLVVGDGFGAALPSLSAEFTVPVVYAFGLPADPNDVCFLPDNVMAGRLAGEHLISIGKTRIAHITANNDLAALDRARGLSQALASAGLSLAFGSPLAGHWSREWGAEAARRIIASGESVDGIFCGNDLIATGAYTVLRDAGLDIPGDVAIVGFDHWSKLSEQSDTLLTTIDPNLTALGGSAVDYVIRAIDGFRDGPVHSQECSLVLGESTIGRADSAPDLGRYAS